MKKRIISLLLAVVMIAGMLPLGAIPAFAEEAVTEYFALDISTGAYIDTGFKPTSNTRVVFDAEVTVNGTMANLFGVWNEGGKHFYANDDKTSFCAGFGYATEGITTFASGRHTVELDGKEYKLDGETIKTFPDYKFECDREMYLFALHIDSGAQSFSGQHIRFYSCEVYENGTLAHNYVTAKQGDTVGVLDKITGGFLAIQGDKDAVSLIPGKPVEAQTATCGKPGWDLHYSFNGKLYEDQDCTIEIPELESWSGYIPPTGIHDTDNGICGVCGKIVGNYIDRYWDDSAKKVVETEKPIPDGAKLITSTTFQLEGGWYVLASDVKANSRIAVMAKSDATTNIILMDGCTLTARNGINVSKDRALNIYGQEGDSGKIIAIGGSEGVAGIGSGENDSSGTVTVNGGIVEATGGKYAAGIGDGYSIIPLYEVSGSNVTVNGGTVNATGGDYAAGIGGCYKAGGGTVTVNGGTVTATGDTGAQAIGHGKDVHSSGSWHFGASAVIKAGSDKDHANNTEYTGQKYVQIHFHNEKTCESISDTQHKCSFCEETEDHAWVIGETEHTCSVCGKTESHNWVNDTNSETQHKCSFCGVTGEHSFVNGECTVCGKKEQAQSLGTYIERSWDGSKVVETEKPIPTNATEITSTTTSLEAGKWYVVSGTVTVSGRIMVTGNADRPTNIILMDGCTLTVNGGIEVAADNALYIYGQAGDTGTIEATGVNYDAGIGGGYGGNGGNVNIYGGTVEATGATGGTYVLLGGAGIGGGLNGNGGTVTIYGGIVNATGNNAAGIGGGGNGGNGGNVYIYGGTVTAVANMSSIIATIPAQAIGHGVAGYGISSIDDGSLTVGGSAVIKAVDSESGATSPIYTGQPYVNIHWHNFVDGVCTVCEKIDGNYIERSWDETTKKVIETEKPIPDGAKLITSGTTELESGWYVLKSNVIIDGRILVTGTPGDPTRIILMDGCTLTVNGGIEVAADNALHIYGQELNTGTIEATGGTFAAGIGGGDYGNGGTVTVYGGVVDATGGKNGAGIGGGYDGNGGTVTIYGGTVTAEGDDYAAGIGGGKKGDGGNVNIYGGTVVAIGDYGAGIGGGDYGNGGTLTVYGGVVSATGGDYGAGIGGGDDGGNGGVVTVYGGEVTATGGIDAAGIGGGDDGGNGGTVTIYGGIVNATGKNAAGIGGGHGGNGGNTYIYGGTVTAVANMSIIATIPAQAIGHGVAGYGISGIDDGSLTVGDSAVIKAVDSESGATSPIYTGQPYVNIHWHNYVDGVCTVCEEEEPTLIEGTYIERSWNETTKKVEETEKDIPRGAKPITETTTTLESGWYVLVNDVVFDTRITVKGTPDYPTYIILMNGYTLTANGGINVAQDKALYIFGQTGDEGILIADASGSDGGAAGIGGGDRESGGIIMISGGEVEATGGNMGAGIGGGLGGNGGTVTVNGGIISATGGTGDGLGGAGIGGGVFGSGGYVTVNGGKVTATGFGGAGIGGGYAGNGGNVTVNGGNVTATSEHGAGIGGGNFGNGGSFTITGGTVTVGSNRSVLIGKGLNGEYNGEILILGGVIINGNITPAHEHTFANTYSYDENHHWHASTCGHDTVSGFAVHTFTVVTNDDGSKTYTCVCGYTKVVYDKPDDEGEIISGTTYTGISLTLGSDISINFYMELSDDARQNGKMTFNIGGRIVTVDGKDARYNETEKKYYFQTPLTVLEMNETVTATFTYNGVEYVQEYSVAEYIEEIIGNPDKYGTEAAALAKKIANYGHYAQIYLASIHTNVTIVEPGVDSNKGYDRMIHFGGELDINVENAKTALANYKVTVSGTSDNLSLYGSTVYFDSATALNYYVTVKNGVKPTATAVNKVTGETKQVEIKLYKDNIYIVSVKDITATELADDIEVTINNEITLTGSVFAYCNSVVKAHSFEGATEKDTFAVNAMAAFYEYYKAAVDYAKTLKYYDVTFDMGIHGEDITVKVKWGEKVAIPENPVFEDYVFDGWYTDDNFETPWDFDTPITENTTIYGKWAKIFTVSFNMMGQGTAPSNQRVKSGDKATKPTDPTAKDWSFDGWYTDDTFETPWNFDTPITKNTTIYAKWREKPHYTVSFDMMGHGNQLSSQTVEEGGYAESPTQMYNEEYSYSGCFKDENFQEEWNFHTDTVTRDITLYVKWVKKITVTFDNMGHGFLPENTNRSIEGTLISEPAVYDKGDYYLEGWYTDKNFTKKWNFDTDIAEDTDFTLYAKWLKIINVYFDNMGHGFLPVSTKTYIEGSRIDDQPDLYDSNFYLEGWYKDQNFTKKWNFDTDIVEDTDITLYAKWVAKQ